MATSVKNFDGEPWLAEESVSSNVDEPVNLRKEIEQKKEEKKRQDDEACTFQPTLAARRGRDSIVKPVVGSRFDYLYNDAIKRKEGPKGKTDEPSFKPSISPRARSISTDRKASDMINSLHNASGAGRASGKEVAPKEENSFKPVITRRGSSLERNSVIDTNQRLYEFRTRQDENLQKKKEEAEVRRASECTFAPKVSRSRSASRESTGSQKPVIDRLLQYGEERKAKLEIEQKAKSEKDALSETFQPQIIRSKFAPAPALGDETDVYTRLAFPIEKDFSALLAAQDADLTFQPKVGPHTPRDHLTPRERSSSILIEGESVHDRLFREGASKKIELEEEQKNAQAEEDKKYSFAPTIPVRAGVSTDAGAEGQAPVFDRLNSSRQYMQNILSQIKSDLELNECTFQPALSHSGPSVDRRESEGPVFERLQQDAANNRKLQQQREAERLSQEVEGMTFQPHVPESSQGIARRRSTSESQFGDDALAAQDVYLRLNSAHTVASLGGTGTSDADLSSLAATPVIEKGQADAVVTRLMAAADKHKEDLKLWEAEKANLEVSGATFKPEINSKVLRGRKSSSGGIPPESEVRAVTPTNPKKAARRTPSSPSTPRDISPKGPLLNHITPSPAKPLPRAKSSTGPKPVSRTPIKFISTPSTSTPATPTNGTVPMRSPVRNVQVKASPIVSKPSPSPFPSASKVSPVRPGSAHSTSTTSSAATPKSVPKTRVSLSSTSTSSSTLSASKSPIMGGGGSSKVAVKKIIL